MRNKEGKDKRELLGEVETSFLYIVLAFLTKVNLSCKDEPELDADPVIVGFVLTLELL